jgi:hypothetical protein
VASPEAFMEGLRAGFWLCFGSLCLGELDHIDIKLPHFFVEEGGGGNTYDANDFIIQNKFFLHRTHSHPTFVIFLEKFEVDKQK